MFEQALLSAVLDQDSLPQLLALGTEHCGLSRDDAWAAILAQAAAGRLRAYRGTNAYVPVDLRRMAVAAAAADHTLFAEPTERTHARLQELRAERGKSAA